MKYAKMIFSISFLGIILLFVGCASMAPPGAQPEDGSGIEVQEFGVETEDDADSQKQERFISLYFLNPSESYLFPLTLKVKTAEPVRDVVQLLKMGPVRQEWGSSPIPQGLVIEEITVLKDKAWVDLRLTSDFLRLEPAEAEIFMTSLVYSLTSLDEISRVEFLLEKGLLDLIDFPVTDKAYSREDLQINRLEVNGDDGDSVLLWFSDSNSTYMIPVTQTVEEVPGEPGDAALLLVKELIRGPKTDSEEFVLEFPKETDVVSLKIEGRTAEVDFNQEFMANYQGGTAEEWGIINALVLTLTELPQVDRVQLLVEGRKEASVLGHISTDEPLERGQVNWVLMN